MWELLGRPSGFGAPERTATHAQGTRVLFADGHWRLCATSGLWNANLGYGNRRIADAVGKALIDHSYLSLFRSAHTPAINAARALLGVCGEEHYAQVLFTTSGGSANDAAMKLARQYWALQRQFRRRVVVGLHGSYHGLTYGSHGLTGESLAQSYYSVDQRWIRHVGHQDAGQLTELLATEGESVAAIVVEPVLGTGAYPLSQQMVADLLRLRREHGFLLVADEVATGFGRTGPYFASQEWPESPDILLASKGLTNGTCAAAAVVVSAGVQSVFARADAQLVHAETQAGSPSTCAAIVTSIEEVQRLDALQNGKRVSAGLDSVLGSITNHPLVRSSGGTGCFRSIRLHTSDEVTPTAVVDSIRRAGALVSPGPGCVQLAPALVYGPDDLEELERALWDGLNRTAEESS
ncbi:aspartate aminotransferase family protein [Nocardiopsis sp. HNM0947]|uniref:Aspartate aminotransferase family protein n=1 Tax=Nocardiopsis coralli TaxID=2772213 RepID=A0ABR9P0C9_9ACTN|nr:aspartate aminotransferase family protein [Nocardiopsis coralli]